MTFSALKRNGIFWPILCIFQKNNALLKSTTVKPIILSSLHRKVSERLLLVCCGFSARSRDLKSMGQFYRK